MKQQIHINDQGELLLKTEGQPDVKFRDQEAVFRLLFNQTQRSVGFNFWKDHLKKGQSFDLPNSYTAQVEYQRRSILTGDWVASNENEYKSVDGDDYIVRKVAVLTLLKQEHGIAYEVKTGSSYENFRVLTEAEKEELLKPGNGEGFRIKILGQSEGRLFVNGEEYVKKQSGEPGNEAKKEVGKCVECGAYTGHSVNCGLIDLEEAKKQLKQYYDLWLTREMWVRKRGNMWRTQAEKWKGKFFEVKNENNKLRKKLPTKPLK